MNLTVQTQYGPMVGFTDTSPVYPRGPRGPEVPVYKWLGIPYAKAKRWGRPEEPEKWEVPLEAYEYRERFMEVESVFDKMVWGASGLSEGRAAMSEEGFYVNVASTARERRGVPVLVWVYGGGLENGSADRGVYDPTAFLRWMKKNRGEEAVVVSGNYRTNVFGFFAHADVAEEDPEGLSGNYGVYDVAAMLKWVRENAAAFGGDPERVTAVGASAGAVLLSSLIVHPEGLFSRLILHSGAPSSLPIQNTDELAAAVVRDLSLVSFTSEARLASLRALSAHELLLYARMHSQPGDYHLTLETSGRHSLLSEPTMDRLRRGEWHPSLQSVLLLSNEDEGTLFAALAGLSSNDATDLDRALSAVPFLPPAIRPVLRDHYLSGKDSRVKRSSSPPLTACAPARFLADALFDGPVYELAHVLSSTPNATTQCFLSVFLARLRDQVDSLSNSPMYPGLGAFHSMDLAFLFTHSFLWPDDSHETRTAAEMNSRWISFASSGVPGPHWPAFTPHNPTWFVFDKDRQYVENATEPFLTRALSSLK